MRGPALGYHVRTPQRGQAESGELEGTSSFRIDLNTQRLEGKIISYLNKSPWYTFSVQGTLTGALFAWDDIQLQNNATSASGNTYSSIGSKQGGGVWLAAGNQDEIVGDLSLTGKNSSGDDLRTYLAFGGSLQDTNQMIFTGKNGVSLNEGSRGVLLKGDGEVLESVGRILHEVNDAERTYTHGMPEVRP